VETVKNPANGHKAAFESVAADLHCHNQEPWVLHPGDKWHGFDNIAGDWRMIDPIKVSTLSPGMGKDGKLEKGGLPTTLVNAWFNRFGIVLTRDRLPGDAASGSLKIGDTELPPARALLPFGASFRN